MDGWIGLDLSQNITPPRAPCGANNHNDNDNDNNVNNSRTGDQESTRGLRRRWRTMSATGKARWTSDRNFKKITCLLRLSWYLAAEVFAQVDQIFWDICSGWAAAGDAWTVGETFSTTDASPGLSSWWPMAIILMIMMVIWWWSLWLWCNCETPDASFFYVVYSNHKGDKGQT